ncbi:Uma2 family endonuclease [Saccharothrix longispora]|uniref:Uma2 family endonuclease n=1 Tax=Saccharothrix longispora TaxID=33920 RepID=UPI0028FDB165|nr:Uma2 family endonuclease [Saccharothrix longispora]MDU0293738.1 Uma2 family endonuclease [Saccharothrix longispora]
MSILEVEMSAALQHPVGPHTVDEWLALPPAEDGARTELILGYLHVSPAPSGEHQLAAHRLARLIEDAVEDAGRTDLYVVPAVNVKISSELRTALIPDVVVLDRRPAGVSFPAEALALAVEVWSPASRQAERGAKMWAYAEAGVPFVWTLDPRHGLIAHRLDQGVYVLENVVTTGEPVTITASPVAVEVDLARLIAF